jgi:hypothetical protein
METVPGSRHPIGFASYPGDVRDILGQGPFGPNYMGEQMWAVTAEYDAETNKTRVGFSLIAPDGGDTDAA